MIRCTQFKRKEALNMTGTAMHGLHAMCCRMPVSRAGTVILCSACFRESISR